MGYMNGESPEREEFLREFYGWDAPKYDPNTIEGRLASPEYCDDCKRDFEAGHIEWREIRKKRTSLGCGKEVHASDFDNVEWCEECGRPEEFCKC